MGMTRIRPNSYANRRKEAQLIYSMFQFIGKSSHERSVEV